MEDLVFMFIVFVVISVGFILSTTFLFLFSETFRNEFLNDFWR